MSSWGQNHTFRDDTIACTNQTGSICLQESGYILETQETNQVAWLHRCLGGEPDDTGDNVKGRQARVLDLTVQQLNLARAFCLTELHNAEQRSESLIQSN